MIQAICLNKNSKSHFDRLAVPRPVHGQPWKMQTLTRIAQLDKDKSEPPGWIHHKIEYKIKFIIWTSKLDNPKLV